MFELDEKKQHGLHSVTDYKLEHRCSTEAVAWQKLTEQVQAAIAQRDELRVGNLFQELQSRSESMLIAIASRRLSADNADDVVATAYLDFYDHLRAGKAVANAKALLAKIVRNLIVDHYRSKYVRHESAQDDTFWQDYAQQSDEDAGPRSKIFGDPQEIVTDLDFGRHVNAVLGDVPSHYRQVLEVRIYDELSVADTAGRLGLTVDQVKQYTGRGLKAARKIAEKRGLYDGI